MDDFEVYLARRKRNGKLILIGAGAFLVLGVAIPYALMKAGMMKSDTFDIFAVAAVLLGAGVLRAGFIRLRD